MAPVTPALTVRPISAAEHLAWVHAQRSVSFLQTPAWGRVMTAWRSESLGWYAGGRLVGAGLVLHRPVPHLRRLSLAYLPEGPVIDWSGDVSAWLDPLVDRVRARGAFAIRIGPPVRTHTWAAARVEAGIADGSVHRLTGLASERVDPLGVRLMRQLRDAGWRPQLPDTGLGPGQPQFTCEIPLAGRTEADLLAGMSHLWRHSIRRAGREGIEVTTGTDLSAFHDLYVHSAARDGFTPRPRGYFETMVASMSAEDPDRVRLYVARHRGDPVAAAVRVQVGGRAWHCYGASAADREVGGSHACQWAMIRDALTAGCDVYSLRGITPTLHRDDPRAGPVQFKVGSGGEAVRYVGEWDLVLRRLVHRVFDRHPWPVAAPA